MNGGGLYCTARAMQNKEMGDRQTEGAREGERERERERESVGMHFQQRVKARL